MALSDCWDETGPDARPKNDRGSDCPDSIVIDNARHRIRTRFTINAPQLHNNEELHDFLLAQLGARDNEAFALMLLDVHKRLIEYVELFHGSVDGASIYLREVVRSIARRANLTRARRETGRFDFASLSV